MNSATHTRIRSAAVKAFTRALAASSPGIELGQKGYCSSFEENLIEGVLQEDFEAELRAGDGNELETKFRAAHSSSALAVNAFAPFKRHLDDLSVCGKSGFTHLSFERKCPTGLRGGRAPNLDVVAEAPDIVVAIESKCTEYLSPHRAHFSKAYEEQITDHRRDGPWFAEMKRLMEKPDTYRWLDAAQLIKHAFGMLHTFPETGDTTLLYLFWEPADADQHEIFTDHRAECAEFASRVAGDRLEFQFMSYPELWTGLEQSSTPWLRDHLKSLRARYDFSLVHVS